MAIVIGTRVGNYLIEEPLGSGGMGAVYKARHVRLERQVAIKVLHPQFASDPQIGQRFLNEARAVNIIDHPGVVQISEAERTDDGSLYLVMELLQGESLRERIRRMGVLSGREALRILRQLTEVLTAAHAKGIVHRDLKPENIMLVRSVGGEAEQVKLLDFGIAKLAAAAMGGGDHVTMTGMMMGTPAYMSPEQCTGAKNVDGQSDIYSLGVITYQMLSGQTPFAGDTLGALILAHLQTSPPPLRSIEPSVAENIATLVHRMLAKTPADRPSAREVLAELDRLRAVGARDQAGVSVSTLGQGVGEAQSREPAPSGRRQPWQLAGGVLLVLVLAGSGLLAVRTGRQEVASALRAVAAEPPSAPRAVAAEPPSAPSVAPPEKPRPAPPVAAAVATVRWSVATVPPGAVVIDSRTGEALGTTPCQVQVAVNPEPRAVTLTLPGHAPKTLILSQEQDAVVQEQLQPEAGAAREAKPPRRPKRTTAKSEIPLD